MRYVVIAGPTSTGKSALALEAAEALGGEIVNADSRQIYRGMDVGTAKPSTAERARVLVEDALALEAARHALARGFDRGMLAVERLFFYLPFEHSEALADQELACELTRPLDALEPGLEAYRYALAHRDIIRRFGRFPHRNAILGRASTPEELEFLKGPGSSF